MNTSGALNMLMWVCLVVTNFKMLNVAKAQTTPIGAPVVPCYFVFGDSLVDDGNNNYLFTSARSNYAPYGIDFKGSVPNGRFCNGKTTVDVIAELLGMNYIPAVMDVPQSDKQILGGLNYASAAAGIRDETGRLLGDRFSMNIQLTKFKYTVSQIETLMGDKIGASNHINKCLFTVGLGSNDYVNNYLVAGLYPETQQYNKEDYAKVLAQQYEKQIATLHDYGARKVAIIGPGPVGCSPNALGLFSSDGKTCVENFNTPVQLFNTELRSMVDRLNKNFTDSKFTYIDAYSIFEDILQNAASLGFTDTNDACCGSGRNQGIVTCLPLQTPCPNRNNFIFWDAFHPTEAANVLIGQRSFKAHVPTDVYPVDISMLIRP